MRPDVRIAITGTPGTGKASTCPALAGRGYVALDLKAEAARLGPLGPVDADGVQEVDVEALAHDLETPAKVTFMYSHFAHLLPSNIRSEEHTSELQSQSNLVCRLLLEKKK